MRPLRILGVLVVVAPLALLGCGDRATAPSLDELGPQLYIGKPAVIEVDIDIKPGSDPNSINCNNENESIAVAILSTDDFDATSVVHTTVTFEGASETHVNKKTGEPRRHEEDVDGDGDTDLVLHFRLGETGLGCGSTQGTLQGQTFGGQAIEGTDAVRMIDEGRQPHEITFDQLNLGVTGGPIKAAIGDIDGDGKPDVAVTSVNEHTVTAFRNTSSMTDISFDAGLTFTVQINPQGIAIADLDGDGKPDVATANAGTGTLSVLRNTSTSGAIAFAREAVFIGGHNPHQLASGDMDGDGLPDLIFTNNGIGSVSVGVIRNTSFGGSLSFARMVDFRLPSFPDPLAIGDIDGDGRLDIAAPTGNVDLLSIFRNTSSPGTISFAARLDFPTGDQPASVAIGDIDGDGKADVVVCDLAGSVSVFRNTGAVGTVSFDTRVDLPVASGFHDCGIADLDGDGKQDIVLTSPSIQSLAVLRNTSRVGTISFGEPVDRPTGLTLGRLTVGDVDGDGKPDVVAVSEVDNTVAVFRNTTQ